jgi:hypothetical protein
MSIITAQARTPQSGPNLATIPRIRKFYRAEASRYVVFEWKFDSWEPDHMHWVAPSNFIIYNDGTWFFFAQHLANMRRNNDWGFDTGWDWSFEFDTAYFDAPDGKGTVVHANTYKLAYLHYKDERDNYTQTGTDPRFPTVLGSIQSALGSQHMR